MLLEELASERRWDELFAGSHDLLGQLADEALAEHRAGRTEEPGPSRTPLMSDTVSRPCLPTPGSPWCPSP